MEEYKIFVRDTVNRYKDNVKKWELWNEPNFKEWWYPRPDITLYGRWADAMQQEIKAADSSAQIAWGCLTLLDEGSSNSENYIPGDRFLEDLCNLGYYPDIISLHPYGLSNESPDIYLPFDNHTTFRDVETLKQIMERNGQSNKEIWITEFGWQVGSSQGGILMTEELQAKNLIHSLKIISDEWPYVSVAIWFWDLDRHIPQYAAEADGFELIRSDKTIRPSGIYLRKFLME